MNLRRVDPRTDLDALRQLMSAIEERDLHPAIGERKYFYLIEPPTDPNSEGPGLVAENDRGIMAYLALVPEAGSLWTVEAAVHPRYRRKSVLDDLLQGALWEVRLRGGAAVRLWAYTPEVAEAAERAGFGLERELYQMQVPLPLAESPRFPPGIEVRGLREGVDEEAWLEGNNRVFCGHPENGNWEMADLDRRRRLPWFSSEGLRMAWDGMDLAGFCWTKVPSSRAGEIYVIGVMPAYQGMGLGKALLLEGTRHMHSHHGARACGLYVDATNVPALNMYRSMGFRRHHTDRSYLLSPEWKAPSVGGGTLPVELRSET